MQQIKIVVPSAGRAEKVLTKIQNQIICVPENEFDLYCEYNKDYEIIKHPKLKNLAAKRNWILQKFENVFMVDDDMIAMQRIYNTEMQRNLTESEAFLNIQNLYQLAININAKLFGFSEDPCPNHYNPYKPYMLKGMTGGGAYGILDKKLFFAEETTACDSHFVTLLNTYLNRYSLIDTRFVCFFKDTFTGNGGQACKRTLESEKMDTLFLRKMFGEAIELRKEKKNAKANHQYQRKIKTKW